MLIMCFFLPIRACPICCSGCSASQEIRVTRFVKPTIKPLACCICWTGSLGHAVFPPWNEGPNFGSYKIICYNWLRQSIMVGNMRKRKKGKKKKKTKEQVEALAMAIKTVLKQPEKNAQRDSGEKGWACYCCGKEGHLKWD